MALEDQTRKWIDTQGYPLEMQVAREVQRSGGWWDHSRSYTDPVTGKTREIDLMGIYNDDGPSVQLVFECKHSQDKPWVVFATEQVVLSEVGYVTSVPATPQLEEQILAVAADEAIQRLAFFEQPKAVGFNLARVHTNNQDAAHHALNTVVTAANSLAARMGSHGFHILFVPVIVIDTPLQMCLLSDNADDYTLTPIDQAVVLLSAPNGDRTPIRIVTRDGLPAFLHRVATDAETLVRLLPPLK